MKTRRYALLCVAAAFLFCSCTGTPPNQIEGGGGGPAAVSVAPASAALAPGQSQQFQATMPAGSAAPVWSVNGVANGNSTVGTVDATGKYTAPSGGASMAVTVTATSGNQSASAAVYVVAPGTVTTTNNPMVAQYAITPPAAASVTIQFGTDTTYGLMTSAQQSPAGGGAVNTLVAGMKGFTEYHMRATLQFSDGTPFNDSDHVFTTGGLQATQLSTITAMTTPGMTPNPGIEMLDLVQAPTPVVATDLSGNPIWFYSFTGGSILDIVQPIRPLPNGHFLTVIAPTSTAASPFPAGTLVVAREIDLAGNTIREMDLGTLNTKLANGNFNYVAVDIHHDAIQLPNGHWILIVNSSRPSSDFPTFTGTPTTILGDGLVDLDTNLNPVWVWDSFAHIAPGQLDINRQPMGFPDWTHSNAVLFSPSDGSLLLSMRHQNWIIKIDYNNGTGTGNVLWRLGQGGDFTLMNGTDPTDWFYAQHGPSFPGMATSGQFSLAVFDNGNDRLFPTGVTCGTTGNPPCLYSTGMVLQLDETAKTATFAFHDVESPSFSGFGGNAEQLANNNMELDNCAISSAPPGALILEVTQGASPQTVWQMNVSNFAYRGFRMPSLYPNVQW